MSRAARLANVCLYVPAMKHLTFAEKSLLVTDDAADLLLEYARVLAQHSAVDTVKIQAVGPDGNTVEVSFLLNSRSTMVVETTNSTVQPPDNAEAVRYMLERVQRLLQPPAVTPEPVSEAFDYDLADLPRFG